MSKKATEKYVDRLMGISEPFSLTKENEGSLSRAQRAFIDAYASNGGITKSALKTSGVSRETLDEWKLKDEEFKKSLKIAEEHWVEELRKSAFIRAQSKSDVLLMFLLKAMKPEEFDDDVRKQQYVGLSSNPNNIPVRATLVRDNNINISITSEKAHELRDIITAEVESSESAEAVDSLDSLDSSGPEDPDNTF
jgi:hypothetical protein